MKTHPITNPRPTNAELAIGINQLHYCFEDERALAKIHRDKIDGRLEALVEHLGADRDKPPFMLRSQIYQLATQAAATGATLSGLFMLWKVALHVWPILQKMAME